MARSLDDYITVNERLLKFWADHPDGQVLTEMSYPDERTVRCKAAVGIKVQLPDGTHSYHTIASGHAEEVREGMVNSTSAVENCETSAVGRALALAGYEIKRGIASKEEIQKVERRKSASATMTDEVVPDEMVKVIATLAKTVNVSKDDLMEKLKELGATRFQTPSAGVKKLTPEGLKELEDWLKSKEESDGGDSD